MANPPVSSTPGAYGFEFMGKWLPTINYVERNVVTRRGSSYYCRMPNKAVDPSGDRVTAWQLLASRGERGPSGIKDDDDGDGQPDVLDGGDFDEVGTDIYDAGEY